MSSIAETLAQAKTYHRAGDLRSAEQFYRRVLEADAAHVETLYLLGATCHGLAKSQEAKASLTQAVRLKPDHADAHNQLGVVLAEQGQLDEAIASFQQALRLRPNSFEISKNLAKSLGTRGNLDEAIACYRRALELKPDYAEAHSNLGAALGTRGNLDEAVACYRQALELKPDYAEAHNNLGALFLRETKLDEAAACFRRALELKPDYAEAHNKLGNVFKNQGKLDEAVACYRRALELKPDYAAAHSNLGTALVEQGNLDDAVACYRQALELKPDYAEAHFNLAAALLLWGRFDEAWPEYEWRWRCRDVVEPVLAQPRWVGDELAGRTILLRSEQGFGDTLQFIRYTKLLKDQGARVVVECQRTLASLVARCPGVDHVVSQGEAFPEFDVHLPLLSLPLLLRTELESIPAEIPYLAPDEESVARWKQELSADKCFKIGIAWQGNVSHPEQFRFFPLSQCEPIARLSGVRLYSLQLGPGREQLAEVAGRWPITDLGDRLGDFHNTAAIMCNLDLVISCDSAPVHLAGALGVPVWLALAVNANWRWLLDREDSPWYPTMRLFRQGSLGDWREVFERMAQALADVSSD